MGRREVEEAHFVRLQCKPTTDYRRKENMYNYRYTVQWSGEDCRYTAEFRHIEDALDYWHTKSNATLEWLHTNEEE